MYCTVDGILYSKDMHTLIRCPLLKTGHVDIPDGVSEIGKYAFRLGRINSVSLPDSLVKIERMAFLIQKSQISALEKGLRKLGKVILFQSVRILRDLYFHPKQRKLEILYSQTVRIFRRLFLTPGLF